LSCVNDGKRVNTAVVRDVTDVYKLCEDAAIIWSSVHIAIHIIVEITRKTVTSVLDRLMLT